MLKDLANHFRYQIIEMSHQGKGTHVASALSSIDLITFLYFSFLKVDAKNADWEERDRFMMSKGHAISALYTVLAEKGFFPKEWLETYNRDGSPVPEHPIPKCVPGLEFSGGSLGHGLSFGAGHALNAKIVGRDYETVVLMSDGECNEGSVWEAAQFASGKNLNQLIAVIDYNKWQATGRSNEVLQLSPLREKWEAFGWEAVEIDGHDFDAMQTVFTRGRKKPLAVIANTIKGKGVSFMEDDNNWHYKVPAKEDVEKARLELGVLQ